MGRVYGDWVTVAELARREHVSRQWMHERVRRYAGVARDALRTRRGPRGLILVDLVAYGRIFGLPEEREPPRLSARQVVVDALVQVFRDAPPPGEVEPFADPPAPIANRQRSPRELFGEAASLFGTALRGALASVFKYLARAL
jgi:hypothetical protein